MGGSETKPSNCGQVYIQLSKPFFYINEPISGIISLNVVSSGFPGSVLYLKFKGKEYSKKVEHQQQGKHRHTVNYILKNNFYKQMFQIFQYSSGLDICQQQFPFSIPINMLNVTSFNYEQYHFKVNIYYQLSAFINTQPKSKLKENIKARVNVIIIRPYIPLMRPFEQTERKEATVCCCCSKGTCIIKAQLPITDFSVGQMAQINLHIDNSQCGLAIQEIKKILMMQITVRFPSVTRNVMVQCNIEPINGNINEEVYQYYQEFLRILQLLINKKLLKQIVLTIIITSMEKKIILCKPPPLLKAFKLNTQFQLQLYQTVYLSLVLLYFKQDAPVVHNIPRLQSQQLLLLHLRDLNFFNNFYLNSHRFLKWAGIHKFNKQKNKIQNYFYQQQQFIPNQSNFQLPEQEQPFLYNPNQNQNNSMNQMNAGMNQQNQDPYNQQYQQNQDPYNQEYQQNQDPYNQQNQYQQNYDPNNQQYQYQQQNQQNPGNQVYPQ